MKQNYPWIPRELTDRVFHEAIEPNTYHVFNITAGPGGGKTFLARDLGTRFGSEDGYQPSLDAIGLWLGIFDIYDPDTNSNHGVETRIRNSFLRLASQYEEISKSEIDNAFYTYDNKRFEYETTYGKGIRGSELEKIRQETQTAFFIGLSEIATLYHIIMAFDTTERLENIASLEIETSLLKETKDNNAYGIKSWLYELVKTLSNGALLFLGRPVPGFHDSIIGIINKENEGDKNILHHSYKIPEFSDPELEAFFKNRIHKHSEKQFEKLLTRDVRDQIISRIGRCPLYLDLVIEMILEEESVEPVIDELTKGSLKDKSTDYIVGKFLIEKYVNTISRTSPDRKTLFTYLAVARNSLFKGLLQKLEPDRHELLMEELKSIKGKPFIKFRYIETKDGPRESYFLHDAMYRGWDEAFITPLEAKSVSQLILAWYEQELENINSNLVGIDDYAKNTLTESLFYRMRANIQEGYEWYLQTSDKAIRAAQLGLDIQLRDAFSLYIVSGTEKESIINNELNSNIDICIVQNDKPELLTLTDFHNVTLQLRRYMLGGDTTKAQELGKQFYNNVHDNILDIYTIPYCEFLLWYGQSIMYCKNIRAAREIYSEALAKIHKQYTFSAKNPTLFNKAGQELSIFEKWYLGMILGRLYNNLGYIDWMYEGKYSEATTFFQQAIHYHNIGKREEERATSQDNLARVYALQGKEFESYSLMRKAKQTREELGLIYREALSDLSIALILNRFHRFDPALKSLDNADKKFANAGINVRGDGLVALAKAKIMRAMADEHQILLVTPQQALQDYIQFAINAAIKAVRIFSEDIKEPIRLVDAYNELGSCYCTQMGLLLQIGENREAEYAFGQSRKFFLLAIEESGKRENNFRISELDSQQDLAVLYFRKNELDKAQKELSKVRNSIPERYKFIKGKKFNMIDVNNRIDMNYKLMGLVEMLESPIIEKRVGKNSLLKEDWKNMLFHYMMAMAYFNIYSDPAHTKRIAYDRIYKRFSRCPLIILKTIVDENVDNWIDYYSLPETLIKETLDSLMNVMI